MKDVVFNPYIEWQFFFFFLEVSLKKVILDLFWPSFTWQKMIKTTELIIVTSNVVSFCYNSYLNSQMSWFSYLVFPFFVLAEKNGNSDDLEPALESIGQKVRWQFILFLLVSAPGVLNAIHISVYVFVTHNSPHWCTIPDLENANWTSSQIRSFSIPEWVIWTFFSSLWFVHLLNLDRKLAVT